MVPLVYLFSTGIIQAGQANNQQTALSIAEHWAEVLSNATPPVYSQTGAVVVDHSEPPSGPAATVTPATVAAASNNHALNSVTQVTVNSTANFAAATAAVPQTAYVITGTAPNTVSNQITYTSIAGNSLVCPSTCSTAANVMQTGNPVTQTEVATPTETRGNTVYTLQSEYEWTTVQNTGVTSVSITGSSVGATLPQSTIYVSSVANLLPASSSSPQTLKVPTNLGNQTVTYTGIQASPAAITGVAGGTGTMTNGTATQTPKPNLCTSGTPQLLKLTVTVSWGPNADVNNVQDSVILNYPPSGVQTLGFIALQFTGNSGANDAQGDPWSERVQAVPVTIAGPETVTIYPDPYGCAFAQVLPGNYSVTVANASPGIPAGTNYGSPSFVANAAGSYTSNVWKPPTTEPQGGSPSIPVTIGAVTRVDTQYSANYPGYDQGATVNFSYSTASAVEDGVTCPGSGQIVCVTSGEGAATGGAELSWLNSANGAWSTATVPSLPGNNQLTRLTSMACTTTACIGVGYGTTGAVILHATTNPASLSGDTVPVAGSPAVAVTNLSNVVCLTSVATCTAIGTNSSGQGIVLTGSIGANAGSDTWAADTLPNNVTSLSSLQCSNASNGCVAVATTTTANSPVLVSGTATSGGGAWAAGVLSGVTLSALTQVVCANATACVAIGTGKIGAGASGPIVLSDSVTGGTGIGSPGSTSTWTADTYNPPTISMSSVSSVVCPVGGATPKCLVAGTGTSGATTGAVFLYGPPAGPLAAEFPMNGANPITSITQVTCPASTQCVLAGVASGNPILFTGTINAAPATADTWTADTISASGTLNALTQLVCQSANNCLAAATGTASGLPTGYLLATSNGSTWAGTSLPSADSGLFYLSGLACVAGSGACAAVGSTNTNAVVLSSSSGPTGSWNDGTPSALTGYYPTGIPIEINNSGLLPNPYVNAVQAGYAGSITQLPLLFPFQAGYSMWAGDCQSETTLYNVAQAATVPGGVSGSTAGMPSPVVPLGLVSFLVTHKTGANAGLPFAGVSVTLTAANLGAGCSADTYTLQGTGADGLSRTEVPYTASGAPVENYTVTMNGTNVGTVTVAGNQVTFTPTVGGATAYPLPTPIPVQL